MKTLIKNARIYDGTGSDPFMGSVLLEDEKIKAVIPAASQEEPAADKVIDLGGLSLSPGFIDGHSHNDWFAIRKDPFPYFEPFLRQGVTTYVTGNCGLSVIGFEDGNEHVDLMGGGLFFFNDTTGKYGMTEDYFKAVDRNAPANIAILAGHCSARAAASGSVNRPLTEEETQKMLDILEQQLQQGAAGISLGMMYDPGLYADVEELKKVAALCVKYDRPLTVHARAESKVSGAYKQIFGRSHLLRALDELVEVAKGTPLKLQYSHAIFVGRSTFKDKDEFKKIIRDLRANGVDAMFDIYDETLGVSVITVIMPPWYQSMSPEEKRKKSNFNKFKLITGIETKLVGFGFNDIEIAYLGPGMEEFEGKTVHQIAVEKGVSDAQMYLDLCEKSNFKGRVNQGPYTTREIIEDFEKDPNCLFMTDAWVEDYGVQNPALYDNFPKFLHDSLTGKGGPMPDMIRKMTGGWADRFRLEDRGYVRPGCYADLTVFDEDELRDTEPDQKKPFGIRRVFMNGKEVLCDGEIDKESLRTAGMAIAVK
ncbi:MAG: amidohydrolase family protein [Clostridiales bacterium]|nr:amidohydrolase family protein [Clostridiales bacterium]